MHGMLFVSASVCKRCVTKRERHVSGTRRRQRGVGRHDPVTERLKSRGVRACASGLNAVSCQGGMPHRRARAAGVLARCGQCWEGGRDQYMLVHACASGSANMHAPRGRPRQANMVLKQAKFNDEADDDTTIDALPSNAALRLTTVPCNSNPAASESLCRRRTTTRGTSRRRRTTYGAACCKTPWPAARL